MSSQENKFLYVVVGTGSLAVYIAEYLQTKDLEVAIYEMQLSQYSSVMDLCETKRIPYKRLTKDAMTEQLLMDLQKHQLRVISAINTYIFPEEIVEHSNFNGINYHNALLPYHRGMNAEAWAIYQGDEYTGITWHLIASRVDQGEVVIQKRISLDSAVTSIKLLQIQLDLAYETFLIFAESFINDTLIVAPQLSGDEGFHKMKDVPNNGFIDLAWDMEQTVAFLRALDYGFLYTLGKPIVMVESAAYACGRYQITTGALSFEENAVMLENNKIIILKKGSSKKIILSNIKKV